MSLSSKTRWRSSERIAQRVLEEMGLKIVDIHKKVIVDGIEVGEIDFVAEDPTTGDTYGVEVKAGKIDITGLRQVYVNCLLANLKPLVICKGFADDSASILAEKLGIKVVQLSDWFLVESEELEVLMREVMEDLIEQYFIYLLLPIPKLKPEYEVLIEAISESSSISEAAEKLGMKLDELARRISSLRSSGILPPWARKYRTIKRLLELYKLKKEFFEKLSQLISDIDTLRKELELLRKRLEVLERISLEKEKSSE